MALTVAETVDSLKLSRIVRDGYAEPRLTRRFIIRGADDPAQSIVASLTPQQGTGYFTQNSNVLSATLTNATAYTSLPIQGSLIAIASGATLTLGTNGASQTVTTSAPVAIGATSISVASFTTARVYSVYTPVTPGVVAPVNTLGLYCNQVDDQVKMDTSGGGPGVIERVATYGPAWRFPAQNTPTGLGGSGLPLWDSDIQTENVHIQTALSQTHWPATADDVGMAIGVQGDGTIQGVDILVPKSIVKARMKQVLFSQSYQDTLELLVGTTNVATFNGWAAGRLLFLGCVASQKGQGLYECEYIFLKQPASVTTTFNTDAGGTQNVVKAAHNYLWIRSHQKNVSGTVTMVTQDVHVATVYPTGDYSGIIFNQ